MLKNYRLCVMNQIYLILAAWREDPSIVFSAVFFRSVLAHVLSGNNRTTHADLITTLTSNIQALIM